MFTIIPVESATALIDAATAANALTWRSERGHTVFDGVEIDGKLVTLIAQRGSDSMIAFARESLPV